MDLILIIITTSILGLVLLEAIISYRSDRQVEEVDIKFTLPRVEPRWVYSMEEELAAWEVVMDQTTSIPMPLLSNHDTFACHPEHLTALRSIEMYGAGVERPLIITGQGTSEVRTYPQDM